MITTGSSPTARHDVIRRWLGRSPTSPRRRSQVLGVGQQRREPVPLPGGVRVGGAGRPGHEVRQRPALVRAQRIRAARDGRAIRASGWLAARQAFLLVLLPAAGAVEVDAAALSSAAVSLEQMEQQPGSVFTTPMDPPVPDWNAEYDPFSGVH